MIKPSTRDELKRILQDRRIRYGAGTKKNPISFNDVDVSEITNMSMMFRGRPHFSYIDISEWDVSNVTDAHEMFDGSKLLMSVGDISEWDVSNIQDSENMFRQCNVSIIPNWYDITTHRKRNDS